MKACVTFRLRTLTGSVRNRREMAFTWALLLYAVALLAAALLVASLVSVWVFRRKGGRSFNSRVFLGQTRHARLKPVVNQFAYSVNYFCFDVEELPTLMSYMPFLFGHNRFAVFSLYDRDYLSGDRSGTPLIDLVRQHLTSRVSQAAADKTARVELITVPRYLGYAFNPASFFYCYDSHDVLVSVIVEVNNTFGERHTYVMAHEYGSNARSAGDHTTQRARMSYTHSFFDVPRMLHVSPFNDRRGAYEMHCVSDASKLDIYFVMRDNKGRKHLTARLVGNAVQFTPNTLMMLVVMFPITMFATVPRILWEAGKIAFRHLLPVYAKPNPHPISLKVNLPTSKEKAAAKQFVEVIRATLKEQGTEAIIHMPVGWAHVSGDATSKPEGGQTSVDKTADSSSKDLSASSSLSKDALQIPRRPNSPLAMSSDPGPSADSDQLNITFSNYTPFTVDKLEGLLDQYADGNWQAEPLSQMMPLLGDAKNGIAHIHPDTYPTGESLARLGVTEARGTYSAARSVLNGIVDEAWHREWVASTWWATVQSALPTEGRHGGAPKILLIGTKAHCDDIAPRLLARKVTLTVVHVPRHLLEDTVFPEIPQSESEVFDANLLLDVEPNQNFIMLLHRLGRRTIRVALVTDDAAEHGVNMMSEMAAPLVGTAAPKPSILERIGEWGMRSVATFVRSPYTLPYRVQMYAEVFQNSLFQSMGCTISSVALLPPTVSEFTSASISESQHSHLYVEAFRRAAEHAKGLFDETDQASYDTEAARTFYFLSEWAAFRIEQGNWKVVLINAAAPTIFKFMD